MRPFALLMASVLAADWSAAVELQLGLLDSMTRHDAYLPLQQQHADSRQLLTVTIAAAGRERESTQVLLRSQVNTSVRVAVTRPAELPADALRVERLGFVWANNATSDPDQTRMFPIGCPSDELRKGGCWVPDPVLPLQNHGTVFLPAGLTVSLWLTFAAPAGVETLGRTYNASLTIADHTLALQLQVRHFALPLTPSLKTTVQLDVAHLHRCFPSEPEEATYRRYRQCVLHCRRSLSFSLSPPPSSPFSSLCACVRARALVERIACMHLPRLLFQVRTVCVARAAAQPWLNLRCLAAARTALPLPGLSKLLQHLRGGTFAVGASGRAQFVHRPEHASEPDHSVCRGAAPSQYQSSGELLWFR